MTPAPITVTFEYRFRISCWAVAMTSAYFFVELVEGALSVR